MEPEHSKKQKVLAKLHKRGLHFVLCRANKAALETGWQRGSGARWPRLSGAPGPRYRD